LEIEYFTLSWHLEKQINIMRHCHEFGKCRSAQYGMIRRFEVSNFEFNEFGAVVILVPKVTGRTTVPSGCTALLGTMP
jgi:hypothetical protein